MERLAPGTWREPRERVLPGALSLADRSPTPMRERAVSFGSESQQTYDKHQPVEEVLKAPAATFPPRPPASQPQSLVATAKDKKQDKYWNMMRAYKNNKGGPAPWHVNPSFKGKGKGKQKGKQYKGKGKKKGKFQK